MYFNIYALKSFNRLSDLVSSRPLIAFLLICQLFLFIGCSPKHYIIDRLSRSMGSATDVYLSENDPQLVREAFPFNLKTIEMLVQQSPDNPDLLTAAASGFALYSYAFILEDAERMAVKNISLSRPIFKRARKLFERSRDYGLRALEANHAGFIKQFEKDPAMAVNVLSVKDISAIYWTAASIAGAVTASQGDPILLIDLPKVGYLFEKAFELNPNWNDGALYSAMMKYELSRPDASAQSVDIARGYYQKALELSGGMDCSLYVSYAEAFSVRNQNREEFTTYINYALDVDVDAVPQKRLSNILAQDRANWLLQRIDELFYY